ncbi:hypothetical protein Q7P37_007496 [Cladosporium fusiforme]
MALHDAKYTSVATATTTFGDTDSQQPPMYLKPASRMKALGWILLNFLMVIVPVVAFTAAILSIIFFKRADAYAGINTDIFPQDKIDDSKHFHVDIEAATFVYIASWSSTIASFLTGCIVVLLGYPLAAALRRQLRASDSSIAAAPQALLLVQLFAGQKLSVYQSWLALVFKHRGGGAVAFLATASLSLALLIVALIIAADAYLHLSTKSVTFTDATLPVVPWSQSFALQPGCTVGNNSIDSQMQNICTLTPPVGGNDPPLYVGDMAVVYNESLLTTVYTYDVSNQSSNTNAVGSEPLSYAYAGASNIPSYVDFVANTFASSTQCKVITPSCTTNATSINTNPISSYDCGPDYPGFKSSNIAAGGSSVFYFTDESASSEDNATAGSRPDRTNPNAFTWGVASANTHIGQYSVVDYLHPGQEAFEFNLFQLFFVLCNTSVWNATYTSFNGSVVPNQWAVESSNSSVSNMVASGLYLPFVGTMLPDILSRSTQNSATRSVQDAMEVFASRANALLLSVATAGMRGHDPIAEQRRDNRVVSEVRKDAVYYFIGANLAMALLGGFAFLAALIAVVWTGEDGCDVVQLLSIEGIVDVASRASVRQ